MLDRLEALAREAADEAEGDWFCPDLLEPPYPPINSTLTARRYMAALDPAAMLKLIAVAREAQALADSVDAWNRDVEAVIGDRKSVV